MSLNYGNRRALLVPAVATALGPVRTTRLVLELASGAGPYAFNDIDVGPADASKVIGVMSYVGMSSGTVAVTMDGVTMSNPVAAPSGTRHLNYHEKLDPTATQVDLLITPSVSGQWCVVEVFTVTGQNTPGYSARSGTAPATGTGSDTSLNTGSLTSPAGGIVSAAAFYNTAAGTVTWTPSGTVEFNQQVGSGPVTSFEHFPYSGAVNPSASHAQAAVLMRALAVAHG